MKFNFKRLVLTLTLMCMIILSACSVETTNDSNVDYNSNSNCNHTFSEWTTIKDATCTEVGLSQRYCSVCNYTESKSIDATGHKKEIIQETFVASCTSYGGTKEGFVCTVCGTQEIDYNFNSSPSCHDLEEYDSGHLRCTKCEAITGFNWNYFYNVYGSYETWESNMSQEVEKYMYYDAIVPKHDYITSILPTLFKGSNITAITMVNNITKIEKSAFEDCDELSFAQLPSSVAKIESKAFANCTSLIHIQFNGSVNDWNNIEKASDWDENTGDYTVFCSDGTVTK